MTEPYADERLQFFLRNRDDIKTWAAIENDIMAATRDLLAQAQPAIEERLLAIDPNVVVERNDSGSWERILARHQDWPRSVGLTLEWPRAVDPAGGNRPKVGVFWWADPTTLVAPRVRFVEEVDKGPLTKLGFKIPWGAGVWPVGRFVQPDGAWWQDPAGWIGHMVDLIADTWPLVAPSIDQVLIEVSRK